MENEASRLAEKAQELGDLELAVLLCLIAGEHCIIEADVEDVEQAETELLSICTKTFGLSTAILRCDQDSTLDDFGEQILVHDSDNAATTPKADAHVQTDFFFSSDATQRRNLPQSPQQDEKKIADVVIARDLHLACQQVQIQALELMRSKRVFTRTAIHTAPKRLLLIALITADKGPRLVHHLNDYFFISHYFQSEDAVKDDLYQHENASTGSVVRSPPITPGYSRRASYVSYSKPFIQKPVDIDEWTNLSSTVKLSSDVRAYMHNIVVFMRMHRAVASGVTPHATRHLYALTRALAPLHELDFITPSLVALAVQKIYPHRLTIVKPEDEMSLQWGSEVEAVREYLEGIGVEDVIEDVLGSVETPL